MTASFESDRDLVLATLLECTIRGEAPPIDQVRKAHPEMDQELQGYETAVRALEALGGPRSSNRHWPTEVGRYRPLYVVGKGAMGTVLLARSMSDGRLVALKLIDTLANSARTERRFQQEAQLALRVRHPNLVSVYEQGADQQYSFYAMEFVPGATLDTVLQRVIALRQRGETVDLAGIVAEETAMAALRAGIDVDDLEPPAPAATDYVRCVARIIAEVADALAHLHAQQILHRDVKPSNIMLGRALIPRLTDFGLARDLNEPTSESMTVGMLGTLDYMSPEMIRDGAPGVDARTDVYSLGVTLYELLTLRRPQRRKVTLVSHLSTVHEDPPAPRQIDKEIPDDLETIVLTAIERDRRHRYATAAELAEDLRRFLRNQPIKAKSTALRRRIARRLSRLRRWALLLSALLLLAAGIAAFVLMPGDARHREVLEQVRELLAADRLTDARILLEVTTGLPDSDELRGLRRLASGIIPVRITSNRGGVRITATPFNEYTEFGEPRELGNASTEGILDASLQVGHYRLSVVSAGFGSAEVVVEVPARHQHPGVRVNVQETQPMLVGMQLIPTQTYPLGFTSSETLVPFDLETRLVQLPAFYIDKYEVRNSEYARFVAATGARAPWPRGVLQPEAEDLPVVGVTWSEANDFAEWAGKRLPTQDEWEAAARGLAGNLYPWGNEFVAARAHCGAPDRRGRFVPRFVAVDSATEDTSPFGILHLTGNVREWAFDVWVPRHNALPNQVWQRPPPDYRVVKGSSMFERANPARYRASMRGFSMPDEPLHINRHDIGFRCAKTAHP